MIHRRLLLILLGFISILIASCSDTKNASPKAQLEPTTLAADQYQVKVFSEDLEFPWGIAFIDKGTALITERTGKLRLYTENRLHPEPITGTPDVYAEGQGGLLDIVLSPDFSDSGILFLSYSTGTKKQNATAVMRARLEGMALVDSEVIFTATPWKDTSAHFGGRMIILPDNTLVLTLGDGFTYREQAQRKDNHLGTLVRINLDGSLPSDNPFANEDGPAAYVYSYGHRNVQGLSYDPSRNIIWENEHGPKGGDELNIITPGTNYGWPIVTLGVDYNGARISPFTRHEDNGFTAPNYVWVPSIAPGGMTYYSGALFPNWTDDVFIAGLASKAISRLELDAKGQVISETLLLTERAERIRHVVEGPDGALYALVDHQNGAILQIIPN